MILGRDICGDLTGAMSREWLATNGLGGFACGTIGGANTRRYHGFLVASLNPPVERRLLVAKIDLSVEYLGALYYLGANEFADGTVDPRGFVCLESFAMENGLPVWRYAIADALLEQRIFMAPGANTSYLQGTVWSWLLGPFSRAHYRGHGDAVRAQAFLAPIAQHLAAACLGSVSEVFDGDAPHIARGCFAQAWSVAEILRSWLYLQRKISDA